MSHSLSQNLEKLKVKLIKSHNYFFGFFGFLGATIFFTPFSSSIFYLNLRVYKLIFKKTHILFLNRNLVCETFLFENIGFNTFLLLLFN